MESVTPSKLGSRDEMGRLEKVSLRIQPCSDAGMMCICVLLAACEEVRTRRLTEVGLARFDGFSKNGGDTCSEEVLFMDQLTSIYVC